VRAVTVLTLAAAYACSHTASTLRIRNKDMTTLRQFETTMRVRTTGVARVCGIIRRFVGL